MEHGFKSKNPHGGSKPVPKRINVLFWPLQTLQARGAQTYMNANHHTQGSLFKNELYGAVMWKIPGLQACSKWGASSVIIKEIWVLGGEVYMGELQDCG